MLTTGPARNVHEWGEALFAAVLASGNILLGAFLVLCSDRRYAGPNFVHIVAIAPARVWGLVFVASGLLALIGQMARVSLAAKIGHSVSSGMCLFWTAIFAYSALESATSSPSGVAAYLTLGLLHAVAAPVAAPPPRHP